MQDKIKIDLETGLYIETVHPDETGADIVETPCSESFYLPKWNGESWEEGATQAEIDAIKAQVPQVEPDPITALTTEITALKARLAKVESTDTVKAEMIAIAQPVVKEPTKG